MFDPINISDYKLERIKPGSGTRTSRLLYDWRKRKRICLWSQRRRFAWLIISLSHCHLPPSSSLCYNNYHPRFILFQHRHQSLRVYTISRFVSLLSKSIACSSLAELNLYVSLTLYRTLRRLVFLLEQLYNRTCSIRIDFESVHAFLINLWWIQIHNPWTIELVSRKKLVTIEFSKFRWQKPNFYLAKYSFKINRSTNNLLILLIQWWMCLIAINFQFT